jgi:hypothetical protein
MVDLEEIAVSAYEHVLDLVGAGASLSNPQFVVWALCKAQGNRSGEANCKIGC